MKETDEVTATLVILSYTVIGVIALTIWVSYIILLIRRSAAIIPFSVLLGVLALAGGIYVYLKDGISPIVGAIVFVIFMIFAWYEEGLREDQIIGDVQAEQ